MDSGLIAIAAALAMAASTIAPALAQGNAASKAMEGIARQPEAGGTIRAAMLLALALMEAIAIYGLLVAIMLIGKI